MQADELAEVKQFVSELEIQLVTLRWKPVLHLLQVLVGQVSQFVAVQAKQATPDR